MPVTNATCKGILVRLNNLMIWKQKSTTATNSYILYSKINWIYQEPHNSPHHIVIIHFVYLSQKLSVCSCIKWLVHQMLSTQVLRRGVYSAERLPVCPLSKISRIICIKSELCSTERRESKSMHFWIHHSLKHRNGSSKDANSALKHRYKPASPGL